MRLVVASCWGYRDAWSPFFQLLSRFWPGCPYSLHLLTDHCHSRSAVPAGVSLHEYSGNWCENLYRFARDNDDMPMLLLQEDFFLNAPVDPDFIDHCERQFAAREAGCCRLAPYPAADDYGDDLWLGTVRRSTRYRISCQAAMWSPRFIVDILSRGTEQTIRPNDFELDGTSIAESLPPAVLAIRPDVPNTGFSYLCSGISCGLWMPDAKTLFQKFGIHADWSLRSMMASD